MTAKKPPSKDPDKPAAKRKRASPGRAEAEWRRRLFAYELIANGGQQKEAAIKAGFSPGGAASKASQMMNDPLVKEILASERSRLKKKYELTNNAVIEKLAKLIHADYRDLINEDGSVKPVSEWPDAAAAAVVGLEIVEDYSGKGEHRTKIGETKKLKIIEPTGPLGMAMRYFGMFEKDNRQKADALGELLGRLNGNVIGPRRGGNGD